MLLRCLSLAAFILVQLLAPGAVAAQSRGGVSITSIPSKGRTCYTCYTHKEVVEVPEGLLEVELTDSKLHLRTVDPSTLKVAASHTLPSPFGPDVSVALDRVVRFDDAIQVVLITAEREKREGGYIMSMLSIDPETMQPIGAVRRLGEVIFKATGSDANYAQRLNLRTAISPDGEYLAFIFDRLRDPKGNMLLHSWVLESGKEEVRSGVYLIPTKEPDWSGVRSHGVNDRGEVHVLWTGTLAMEEGGGNTRIKGVDGVLIGLRPEGYTLAPRVPQKEGNRSLVTSAVMPDGGIVLAGVGVDDGKMVIGDEMLAGFVIQRYDEAMIPQGPPTWLPLKKKIKASGTELMLFPRPDGGFFIAATADKLLPGGRIELGVLVASFDANNALEWDVVVPRNYVKDGINPMLTGFVHEGDLHLFLADAPGNLAKLRDGKSPGKVALLGKMRTLHARFSNGKVSYAMHEGFRMDPERGLRMNITNGVAYCPCHDVGQKEDRMCFIRIK